MRNRALVLLISLLASACSAPQVADLSRPEASDSPDPGERSGSDKAPAERPGRKARASSGGKRDGAGSGGQGTGSAQPSEEGSEPAAAIAHPETGRYSFAQSGYEEFCQATCDREDLPATQTVDVFHRSSNDDAIVVVSHVQQSDDRQSRSTVRYGRDRAVITELFSRVSYEGVSFADTIDPRPPITSLAFPLRVGDAWEGSWTDDTSGDYRVRVVREEDIAGISTFVVISETRFEGEYDGEAVLTGWVDPRTNMIVKTKGRFSIQSSFGSYNSRFEATIHSGPGYR